MGRVKIFRIGLLILTCLAATVGAPAQQGARADSEMEFGPVVRAYLGYLRNEQEVVDDRASRREVSRAYYRRNSNRIRALRQMAIQIAEETGNDYLPELEAAARDELKNIFEDPPTPGTFKPGDVLHNTFRFLGVVRSGEIFYLFARLDPYEQAELMQKEKDKAKAQTEGDRNRAPKTVATPANAAETTTRPRRASAPLP
ncbi:MAG TPA: hypothetical protein VGX92_14340 [Pyrinomonadaceae bacterium]|jgi:hypothetical protein|nr:hypothetical protein [Pyrinomonadaceae bacterium]